MTAQTIQDAIEAIQDIVSGITGIKYAPDYATGALGNTPAAIVLPARGHAEMADLGGALDNTVTLTLLVMVPHKDTANSIKNIIGYGDTVRNALVLKAPLDGVWVVETLDWEFGPIGWQGADYLGWTFTIRLSNWED